MHCARHPVALLQDDLVVWRHFRCEEGLRIRAGECVDGLVVVAGHDEIAGAFAPFSDQRQLHPVEILRLVRENDRWRPGRQRHFAKAALDQICKVPEQVFLLVFRPLFLEGD
jgi:hypothetical protein